jgi:hypothetical protein
VSNHLPVFSTRDLFIPKLCWSDEEERYLSFDEFYQPAVRRLSYSNEDLHRQGLRMVDNSPEEMRLVVQEMFEVLDGNAQDTDEERALQQSFRTIALKHGLAGFPRIGRAFLHQYAHLVGPAPQTTKHGRPVEQRRSA